MEINWKEEFEKVFQMIPMGIGMHDPQTLKSIKLDLDDVNEYMRSVFKRETEKVLKQ